MAVPTSTYRLQITSSFTLSDAAAVAGYLAELGSGAVYTSPLLQAGAGSQHGYDVVDHVRIDRARGGRAGWDGLVAAARSSDLGLVVDIVPNHMGVADAAANAAWWDLLQLGRASRFASWFDVDWAHGRLLLPVLGDDADTDTALTIRDGELRYHEHRFPIAPGTGPHPGDTPADVHDRQAYRLVGYRRADVDQNYRRFFAVTTLAGLRVEDPAVFDATHAEILRWVREDGLDGLRIDHPDGLADPGGYLDRLSAAAPGCWITVEKILEPGETLPAYWPVAGTTGYDALAEVSGLFIDPSAEPAFDAAYRSLTGDRVSFADHARAGKRHVLTTILAAEVARLARLAPTVSQAGAALRELLVAFPVYRSYLPYGAEHLAAAIVAARTERPDLADAIAALTSRLADPADELCTRFQQTSGAVMAKGVEDTAYYRYSRFVALNEVGGDPARFGLTPAEFHEAQVYRQEAVPDGMTTLSTHDTKRCEDVRARLAVLSELPQEWSDLATHLVAVAPMPNRALGYLLWQTVVGAGFVARERLHAYAEKAMREAADGTGWVDPDPEFEAAVHAALERTYDDPAARDPLEAFLARIEAPGRSNALGQKLVQLTMPGVPDVYRGTELWDDSLVDPDNRRPVAYDVRRALLTLDAPPPVDSSGAAKFWLVSRALRLRRTRPELFASYTPIATTSDHAVAFDRGGAITVVTRLPVGLASVDGWGSASMRLPTGTYEDVLTGARWSGVVPLGDVLASYPVALLADSA